MKSYSSHKTYTANGTHETGKRIEYVEDTRNYSGIVLLIGIATVVLMFVVMF